MNKKLMDDLGIAPLLIIGLMILAGLCVWCISILPGAGLAVGN